LNRVSFVHPPCILYYTHTYTHNRIKETRSIGRKPIGDKKSHDSRKTVGYNNIFSPETTPHINAEGVVRGENTHQQMQIDKSKSYVNPADIRAWRCAVMEQKAGREWVVVVADDALMDSKFGWICDCGSWTFGCDAYHTPVFGRVGKVSRGRRLCRR